MLLVEHELSSLIKVCAGAEEHIILMDAAVTQAGLFSNAALLKADLGRINAVILSRGHPDHFLGFVELLKLIDKERDKKSLLIFILALFWNTTRIIPQFDTLSQCFHLMKVFL